MYRAVTFQCPPCRVRTLQFSRDVPAEAGSICDKAAVFGDMINGTLQTPCSRVLPEKLSVPQPVILWNPKVTSARHLSLSCARSIQSVPPYPTSWRYILILSSPVHLGIPSGLFPWGIPTKTLHKPLLSPISATCPAHLILPDLIIRILFGEEYRSWISSSCSILHSPVTSSLLGPNIFFRKLSSSPLSFVSSLNPRDQKRDALY